MKNKVDIIGIGECLIDFVTDERDGVLHLTGNPGGAPANVLAMATRLGLSTAMIAKVGDDRFGQFLRRHITAAGVDDAHLIATGEYPTTLAMVSLDEQGNRSFSFYRGQTADVMLRADELPLDTIEHSRVLHFGSVSLTHQPSRDATFAAVRHAREHGAIISYDPNLRRPLWAALSEAKCEIEKGLALSDVVKLSEEELFFLTGTDSLEAGIEALYARYPLQLLAVTLGPDGCILRTQNGVYRSRTFDVPCVDTTGAGDAFWGACLAWLLLQDKPASELSEPEITALMDFANAAGSLATTKKGAIPAMPTGEEIRDCIRDIPRVAQ
ncbi:MAG: carbohydrate kinase [Acetanaerobacterium sp.]